MMTSIFTAEATTAHLAELLRAVIPDFHEANHRTANFYGTRPAQGEDWEECESTTCVEVRKTLAAVRAADLYA